MIVFKGLALRAAAVLVAISFIIVGFAVVVGSVDHTAGVVEEPSSRRIYHPGVFEDYVDDGDGADSGTMWTLMDSDIPYYNDWCTGWTLEMLSGANKDAKRDITGYNALTHTISLGIAFDNPISPGDQYRLFLTEYDMMSIYYMCCTNMTSDVHFLDLVPHISNGDGENIGFPGLNKEDINLTYTSINRMNFSYPRMGLAGEGKGLFCEYDDSIVPFVNLTLNTLGNLNTGEGGPGKEINMEIWFDTDGDYDIINDLGDVEGIMGIDFEPDSPAVDYYTTVGPGWPDTQMEEYADGVGKWILEPSAAEKDMNSGQIFVTIWRTDQIADDGNNATADLILYTGFTSKLSWLNLPYKHPLVNPVAEAGIQIKINGVPQKFAGFNDTLGQDPIREGEIVTFDATMSYDPQDDCGVDGLAFGDPGYPGPDLGEGDGIIQDGNPEGEPDYGEKDLLQYRWIWGAGMQNSGWLNTPFATYTFKLPAMYPNMVYTVMLQVRDPEQHVDWDSCFLMIWDDPGVAPYVTMSVSPDEDEDDKLATVLTGQEFKVTGFATDPDPEQSLSYYWDLNNHDPDKPVDWIPGFHLEFEEPEDKNGTTEFTMKYDDPGYYRITLNVYDGPVGHYDTLNNTDYMIIHVQENNAPEGVVYAKIAGSTAVEVVEEIHTRNGQDVLFRVEAEDPDLRPGYDIDSDFTIDYNLMYRYDFGDGKTVEWTTETSFMHNYTGKGSANNDYQFYTVSVKLRDGPVSDPNTMITTLDPMHVYVNLLPVAEAGPNLPNLEVEEIQEGDIVYFDGSGSYDPNDDTDNSGAIDGEEADNLRYFWNFGDKSKVEERKKPTHVFEKYGTYTVHLTVTDLGGRSSSDSLVVKVVKKDEPPVFVIDIFSNDDKTKRAEGSESTITVMTYEEIVFDASNCYDPDGEAYNDDKNSTKPYEDLEFEWDFGDGATTSTYYAVYSYPEDGEYHVNLTITSKSHVRKITSTQQFKVYVENRRPNGEFYSDGTGEPGEAVLFDAGRSWDMDGEIVEYRWEWGDELKDPWTEESSAAHVYDRPGPYTVRLFVMDNDGEESMVYEGNVTIGKTIPPDDDDDLGRSVAFVAGIGFLGLIILIALIAAVLVVVRKIKD